MVKTLTMMLRKTNVYWELLERGEDTEERSKADRRAHLENEKARML